MLGPIFKFDVTGASAAIVAKSPAGQVLSILPEIMPLADGVAIKRVAEAHL